MHTDDRAGRLAEALSARAYTVGPDIIFAPGEHSLESPAGQRLLAHELSHVVQQDSATLLHGPKPGLAGHEKASPGHGTLSPKLRAAAPRLQLAPKPKPKPTPPPVAGGNVLYIGMGNFKPELTKLQSMYKGTSVAIIAVTVTEEEEKTKVGSSTFDLTTAAGIKAFAASLTGDAATAAKLETLINERTDWDRDDLAHVISVYAATEKDGVDRMSRVVLSGEHNPDPKIYNKEIKGAIYFDSLVKLAGIFPKAAAQTKHLLMLACFAGEEELIKNYYLKAFPNLITVWGIRTFLLLGPARLPPWESGRASPIRTQPNWICLPVAKRTGPSVSTRRTRRSTLLP